MWPGFLGAGAGGGAAAAGAAGFNPWLAGGMMLGGAALGGLGSLGSTPGRDARAAQGLYNSKTAEGMNRLGMLYFGPGRFMDFLGGTNTWEHQRWPESLEGALAAGKKPEGVEDAEWSRLQGLKRQWDNMQRFTQQMGGPILGQLQGLTGQAQQGIDQYLGGLSARNDAGQRRDEGLYHAPMTALGQLPAMASAYGSEREGVIRRDASKMQNDLDARTRAMLTASGFGGTTEAMQMAGNARTAQEAMQTSLADLADRKLGAQMGAAQAVGAAGMQRADALSRLGFQRDLLATDAQRGAVDQRFNYGMLPLQSTLGVLQGGVMNPWLGQSTSQFIPQGPSGLSQFGGQMGGNLFGLGMLNLLRNN